MSQTTIAELIAQINSEICDKAKCPAKAQVQVRFINGTELVFCGHHFDDQESALVTNPGAWGVTDTRGATSAVTR